MAVLRRTLGLALLLGLSVWGDPTRWEQLRRQPGEDTDRFVAIQKAIPARVKAPGWRHQPLRVGGNFISECWLRGSGRVLNNSFMESAGHAWIRLETLHYKLPDAFGVLCSVGHNPESDGIGVQFAYSHGGDRIVGSSADLDFSVWRQGKRIQQAPVLRFALNLPSEYFIPPHCLPDRSLQRLKKIQSAQSLRQQALEGYAEIVPAFRQALAEKKIKRKEYGEYKGGGIPPEERHVDLSAEEEKRLMQTVEAQVGQWRALMESHYKPFYRAFEEFVPWTPQSPN